MRPTALKAGNTLHWVLLTRDPDTMVLKDADSTPAIAVRKNGASTVDSVTITKRVATTGIYDCSYNPAGEAEGDIYTIEESATITGTITSQATYNNTFSVRVAGSIENARVDLSETALVRLSQDDTGETTAADGSVAKLSQGSSLTGANTVTITVDDGTDPLESAKVRVTKGAQTEVKQTDASGEVEFSLDDGTWDVVITLLGYSFGATTIVVDGDETATYSMTALTPTPVDSPWINARIQCYNASGVAKAGATLTVTQLAAPAVNGYASEAGPRLIIANGSGVAYVPVIPGANYLVNYEDGTNASTYSVPSNAKENDLLGSVFG